MAMPHNVGIVNTWQNSLYSLVNQQLRLIYAESSVGNPYVFATIPSCGLLEGDSFKYLAKNHLQMLPLCWHPVC